MNNTLETEEKEVFLSATTKVRKTETNDKFKTVLELKKILRELIKNYNYIHNTLETEYSKKPTFQINSIEDLKIIEEKFNTLLGFYNNIYKNKKLIKFLDKNHKALYDFIINLFEKKDFENDISKIVFEKKIFFYEMNILANTDKLKYGLYKILNPPISDELSENDYFVTRMKYDGVTPPKKF